jgi:hypothetical protein
MSFLRKKSFEKNPIQVEANLLCKNIKKLFFKKNKKD